MLAAESLQLIKELGGKNTASTVSKQDKKYLQNFEEYMRLAEIYQAYQLIHKFIEESYQAVIQGPVFNEAIFNAARFLVNNLGKRQPLGIQIVYIYYALSYLGFKFEAFKTARFGYEKLQNLKIPNAWQDDIDLATLKVRAKPFSDKEVFAQICNRCMNTNALISQGNGGDACTTCGHPFIRNFIGFDTLPLVEFTPKADIPAKKVLEFLKMDPPEEGAGFAGAIMGNKGKKSGKQDAW
jgi:intraflagellar transport protein 122